MQVSSSIARRESSFVIITSFARRTCSSADSVAGGASRGRSLTLRKKSSKGTASAPVLPVAAIGVAAGVELEARVLALLSETEVSARRSLRNDAIAVGTIVLGVATLIVLWPGDAFHHAVETAIGWFLH